MHSLASIHRSGGRILRAMLNRPCCESLMQRRQRRIHVRNLLAHWGRSKSSKLRTSGAPAGCEAGGGAARVAAGALSTGSGLSRSSATAAGSCAAIENVGALRERGALSSFRRSMCGSADPTCSPAGARGEGCTKALARTAATIAYASSAFIAGGYSPAGADKDSPKSSYPLATFLCFLHVHCAHWNAPFARLCNAGDDASVVYLRYSEPN